MAIPLIPAMTAAEIRKNTLLYPSIAYLSCQFSPTQPAISDLPPHLPPASTVILTDRFPVQNHDPDQIIHQLRSLQPDSILLDLQRPPTPAAQEMVAALASGLPFPVGVTPPYAEGLDCPVFLPPIPPHIPPGEYLHPWHDREIWLELALDASQITVTTQGSTVLPFPFAKPSENAHADSALHCHYSITEEPDALRFYLYRTRDDLTALLNSSLPSNLTRAYGLYQELR
ncbi:MAG: hypothetical protein IJ448_02640 [Oscillospiraceae bacterium]|nr:hypothetical protein [Oscillospiraceae bacterium]